jgi:DNA-binding transcriptional MerR regulator
MLRRRQVRGPEVPSEYSITDLAQRFGITPRTLRFYESKGLLAPKRQANNRVYSERDKARLSLTLRGKGLGLSLEEIREIIEMYDPAQPDDPRQVLYLLQKLHEKRKVLIRKFNDLKETLDAIDMVEERALASLRQRQGLRSAQLPLDLP